MNKSLAILPQNLEESLQLAIINNIGSHFSIKFNNDSSKNIILLENNENHKTVNLTSKLGGYEITENQITIPFEASYIVPTLKILGAELFNDRIFQLCEIKNNKI